MATNHAVLDDSEQCLYFPPKARKHNEFHPSHDRDRVCWSMLEKVHPVITPHA
jgi:hypothetical protein